MRPDEADRMQVRLLRRKSGEERMQIGVGLSQLAKQMMAASIREEIPHVTQATIQAKMRERLLPRPVCEAFEAHLRGDRAK